ncbi:hypothetical protein [Brevundimonas sp. M20]|uniref:hypothetical protein n=1 Tax=Brevundimonas sp. M20 TaxID=2591463 RepID=UPI0011465F3F|nr:hypothetical protein [Brevundimonas sp. M20]QDH73317.1 hypothetical protein FKQ52_07675 [Brevundimonas sp. M20]
MIRGNGVFSPRERRTAIIALLGAAAIAAGGIVLQPMIKPSLGPGGADAYSSAPAQGVMDAVPLG